MVIQGEGRKILRFCPKNWLVGGRFWLLRGGAYNRLFGVLLNIRCFMCNKCLIFSRETVLRWTSVGVNVWMSVKCPTSNMIPTSLTSDWKQTNGFNWIIILTAELWRIMCVVRLCTKIANCWVQSETRTSYVLLWNWLQVYTHNYILTKRYFSRAMVLSWSHFR